MTISPGILSAAEATPVSGFTDHFIDESPTASTEETYSNKNIGEAHTNRQICVLVLCGGITNGSPSAVKVDTTSLTKRVEQNVGSSFNVSAWTGSFASGTTADIKVTWPATMGVAAAVVVFEVHGMATTPFATGGTNTSNDGDFTMNVDADGYACMAGQTINASDEALGWTNADEVAEGFTNAGSAAFNYCAADFNPTSDESPRTFTMTGSSTERGLAGVAFTPL